MVKKAVLIGCNYPGTKAELKGCVNDVLRMHRCLLDRFGFNERDIEVLIDTDKSFTQPTGANIRAAISRLIRSARSGDYLFVHYSGHGTRVPAETSEHDDTGYDECIVPCDMNLITAFADVPVGIELHSHDLNDRDTQLTGRKLPIPILIELLKEITGKQDIHEGNISSTIIHAFGDSASPRLAKSVHYRGIEVNGEEESKRAKKQSKFLGSTAPSGRSVLISACQSDQNAADAKPVVKPEGAYGALSNTIQSILADQAKGEILSNRKLVLMAREKLAKQGFTQRPGLYCTDEVAEEPFLTSDSVD